MKGIITLCGSTRFKKEFNEVNMQLTLSDWVVLSVGAFFHSDKELEEQGVIGPKEKIQLDRLHKEKIAISQAIVVINVGDYVGESTLSEIAYARKLGKKVYWLVTPSLVSLSAKTRMAVLMNFVPLPPSTQRESDS